MREGLDTCTPRYGPVVPLTTSAIHGQLQLVLSTCLETKLKDYQHMTDIQRTNGSGDLMSKTLSFPCGRVPHAN